MINLKKGPVTQLKEDFQKCQAELKSYQENYLRALADFDNYRRRKEKEMEEYKCFANEQLLCELIPILENFQLAFDHLNNTVNNSNDSNYQNLKKGIEIAYRQLVNTLEKFGLKEYSCLGKQFDPKIAEAVGFEEDNTNPPNTIIKELNKGYMLENRVLKPARVIVGKSACESQNKQTETEKESESKEREN